MQFKKEDLYLYAFGLMAIGLPISEFLMSVSFFLLATAWLVNGPKKAQWKAFVKNKLAWSGVILFLLPVVSVLWSSDLAYSVHDLRVKLPLLLVPFFASASRISKKEFYIVLGLLVASTFVTSMILWINYLINLKGEAFNIREVSIFISHIRFSLIIDICIFILLYAAARWRNKYSVLALAMAFWFIYFIFFLGSGNGFLGLFFLIVYSAIIFIIYGRHKKLGLALSIIAMVFGAYLIFLSVQSYRSHFVMRDVEYNQAEVIKRKGSGYFSIKDDMQLENGYRIWLNVSNTQMKEAWRKRSSKEFYKKDEKGQVILGTLTRYLSSKGLTKDSIGIQQLSEEDIGYIESGHFHYKQHEWNNLQLRADQFFFQLMALRYQKDHGNKPLLQRLYYWSVAWEIIKEEPILGVGNGDIKEAFQNAFDEHDDKIAKQYQHRTHNQYLTYFVTGGILSFLIFILAVFYPLKEYLPRDRILTFAQLIMLLSFLTEDTLETEPGVTMYVLFLGLAIALFNANGEYSRAEA